MSSTVEQVKARLSIVDVLSPYLKMEKAGANYKARCPFHNEKTPSFFISPSRDSFHCFGCGKGGDIFTFTQEIEGVDFMGALKILAEKAGVEVVQRSPSERQERSEKEKLHAVVRDATLLYRNFLTKNEPAKKYLAERGITQATIDLFEIGYAPDGWRVAYEFLQGRGHDDKTIELAGLCIPSPKGGLYDRFRGRIMFPIADQVGNVIGFSGRILPGHPQEAEAAKYINSPQTPLYDKSRALYGIDKAKLAIRKEDKVVLVEGQMDLVMSHQSGVTNAVAVSGTALTGEHLQALGRLSSNVIMAFDADNAGLKASGRALGIALSLGMSVKIAQLPAGMDPADLVRKDPAAWQSAITSAKHVIDFYLDVYRATITDPGELRATIDKDLLPYVALLASTLDQGHYISKLSRILGVSEQVIWDAVKKKRQAATSRDASGSVPAPASVVPKAEMPKSEKIIRTLEGVALWQEGKPDPAVDPIQLRARIAEMAGIERLGELRAKYEPEKNELILEAEIAYDGSSKIAQSVEALIHSLREELLTEQFSGIMKQLHEAEQDGQQDRVSTLLADIQKITAQLAALKKSRYTQ